MANTKASSELALTGNFIPSGVTMAFSGASAPSGWLLCDGSAVSRTTYAALYAAIGTAWGNGDGSSTFNLPDLRGRFLRGVDGSAGRDPDKAGRTAANSGGNTGDAVGSVQANATKKNGLSVSDGGHAHDVHFSSWDRGSRRLVGNIAAYDSNAWVLGGGIDRSVDTYSGGGINTNGVGANIGLGNGDNETRPLNANVNYIIKI